MGAGKKSGSDHGILVLIGILIGCSVLRRVIPILAGLFVALIGLASLGIVALVILLLVSVLKGTSSEKAPNRTVNPAQSRKTSESPYHVAQNAAREQEKTTTQPKVTASGEEQGPPLSSEDARTIRDARSKVVAGKITCTKLEDPTVRERATKVLNIADRIVATLRKQPDEIRRSSQFLNYYLPTLNQILGKYRDLEEGGAATFEMRAKILSYLDNITTAMNQQFSNLFENEVLDLSVEIEAMQMAFKRDGLISDLDISRAESEKKKQNQIPSE